MNENTIPLLAIVIPCFNESDGIEETISRLSQLIDKYKKSEIINNDSFLVFVDDGSQDETWSLIESSSIENNYIKGVKLSKNQGHQYALLAGMEFVVNKCDCMVSIDADLQQDENKIEEFLASYKKGNEVVLGIRNDRGVDSFFKKLTALFFYKIMNFMGVKIIKNHADFRLLSNNANKSLLKFEEVNLFLRGLVTLIGFQTDYVYYAHYDRFAGESKYTLSKMLGLAIDGITSFSIVPLRFITFIGFFVFIFSVVMGVYVLSIACFSNSFIPGWASTVLPIYFIGGVQILSLGIVGEYIGKIYKETKRRPRFVCEKTIE
ncbi:glycosyltransferase family 2 protein [Celerinatantimonas yamalensis]|uniref:Glycosyltransferase family 2 protein n=1 Tax=Celerinatantimonas yamalensis TaxID=559956 RepID=A0ABW9G4A6_9GAMM